MKKIFIGIFLILNVVCLAHSAQQELVSGETWGATRTKINANDTELYNAIDTKMTTTTYDSTADGIIDESALPNTLTSSDDNETISGEWTFSDFKFTAISTPTYEQGKLFYSSSEDTLIFYDSHSGTSIEIVREDRIDVFNNTGVTISDGSVCSTSGNTGDQFNAVLADKDTVSDHGVIGVATYDIATGTSGEIVSFGKVHNQNTTGSVQGETWAVDNPLYVGDSGALTNIKPTSGKIIYVGTVLRVHSSEGTIFINIGSAINASDITTGTLSDSVIDSGVTRDTEWDTAAKINAATTDEDFLVDSDIGVNVQSWDADLDTYAGITPSANVQSLLAAATYQAFLDLLAPYDLSPTGDWDLSGLNSFTSGPIAFTGTATLPSTPTDGQAVYYTGGTFDVFGMYFTDTWQYFLAFDTFPTTNGQVPTYNGSGAFGWSIPAAINDSAGNGDTTEVWSADKIYDELQLVGGGGSNVTFQATDPAVTDADGIYINTTDGDGFIVDQNTGISAFTTTYTPYWLLTVSDPGNGNSITSSSAIDCPGTCTEYHANNATPTLTMVATTGYEPLAWTGDATDTSTTTNPDTITMDSAKSVGATFNLLPTVTSFTVDGSNGTMVFSEAVTQGAGWLDTLFNIDGSVMGDNVDIDYVSGNTTNTWQFTLDTAATAGETINLDFPATANAVEDANGGDLQAITDFSVTNNTAVVGLNETFEGTGYADGTWTETTPNGTVDEDYATAGGILAGSQSLHMAGVDYQDNYTQSPDQTLTGSVDYIAFLIRFPSGGMDASSSGPIQIFDSSDTEIARLTLGSSDTFDLTGTGAGTDYGSASALAITTTYAVFIDITKGTGTDSAVDYYLAAYSSGTSIAKPGSTTGAVSGGSVTTNVQYVRLLIDNATEWYMDNVQISSTEITSISVNDGGYD